MIVDGRRLDWIFVTNHYDIHLEGFARIDGVIYHVERVTEWGNWLNDKNDPTCWINDPDYDGKPYADPNEDNYEATPLTLKQKFRVWLQQFLFEIFVGNHWSYKNGKRPTETSLKPEWMMNIYYKFIQKLV